jgi:hypothetical protein
MTRDVTLEPERSRRASSAPEESDFPEPGTESEPFDGGRSCRDSQRPIRLEYHEPQCTICNHPEREDIDQAILHWHSPTAIAFEFDLPDRRIVYRHAHALGLFRQRAEQTRHALGFLIEQAQSVVPTADAIIRAIRALSCIDDRGQWHEPRKEVIITHRYEGAPPPPPSIIAANSTGRPNAPHPRRKNKQRRCVSAAAELGRPRRCPTRLP